MLQRRRHPLRCLLLAALVLTASAARSAERVITHPESGYTFQSPEVRALQDDTFANPGLLWLDTGRTLFSTPATPGSPACADCHGAAGEGLTEAAAHFPRYVASADRVLNLEQRINLCRSNAQRAEPWTYESDELLAATTFVASLARGRPLAVNVDGPARATFDRGRSLYYQRQGQLNLACNHCHELNFGNMLRGDRLSQGHGNGYPAYRLEWQTQGSLHRRLRACDLGVRAEPRPGGAADYVALELFLAWRAAGLTVETPAVRR